VCFAPEADAVVGGLIVAVGVDALRHVRARKQIPLAALPVLFGLHQLSEALVWWGLEGHVPDSLERVAKWFWFLFAFVALPVLLPVAVDLVERSKTRRRVITAFACLGLAVAAALAIGIFGGPIRAEVEGHHVAYEVDAVSRGGLLTLLYVVATCGALLACSYREIAAIGVLNLVAVPILMWLTVSGFVSLWCFWAAIVSIVIALHLRRVAEMRDPGGDERLRARSGAGAHST